MNFLLYMLGAAGRRNLRPIGRSGLRAAAAREAAAGDWRGALDHYQRLADTCGSSAIDALVHGHLSLVCGELSAAAWSFAAGIDRLLTAVDPAETSIGQLLDETHRLLQQGRHVRATETLVRMRAILQLVIAAEAGLILAQDEPMDHLAALVRLEDLSLHMLARAQLVRQLACWLQVRQLRADMAVWATPSARVQKLLEEEYQRLTACVENLPEHAQWQYRRALASRTAGHMEGAADAFQRVLAVHPHHVPSAVGLAVAREQLGQVGGRKVLERAFHVPAETMRLFANFAGAVDPATALDAWVERNHAGGWAARGNLSLALSEMGLLDATHESWRETAAATVTS
jgi:hypothetical protein